MSLNSHVMKTKPNLSTSLFFATYVLCCSFPSTKLAGGHSPKGNFTAFPASSNSNPNHPTGGRYVTKVPSILHAVIYPGYSVPIPKPNWVYPCPPYLRLSVIGPFYPASSQCLIYNPILREAKLIYRAMPICTLCILYA